ncbi:hypothetical protein LMH87_004330 [Akanthomyces muscarius]|uniref:Uncharacterized protein n=1 Tax=Akanthomyces muscarius TaxID=2231603 RepID=A0A9W8Q512_AKAMU|nr:hypothetical protein LMH87_004330 [Akanthomyces muscarius]KAJ4145481.1 hypothetical protein LMH87_004330 [Akanthomyces muscarius]
MARAGYLAVAWSLPHTHSTTRPAAAPQRPRQCHNAWKLGVSDFVFVWFLEVPGAMVALLAELARGNNERLLATYLPSP